MFKESTQIFRTSILKYSYTGSYNPRSTNIFYIESPVLILNTVSFVIIHIPYNRYSYMHIMFSVNWLSNCLHITFQLGLFV